MWVGPPHVGRYPWRQTPFGGNPRSFGGRPPDLNKDHWRRHRILQYDHPRSGNEMMFWEFWQLNQVTLLNIIYHWCCLLQHSKTCPSARRSCCGTCTNALLIACVTMQCVCLDRRLVFKSSCGKTSGKNADQSLSTIPGFCTWCWYAPPI